MRLKDKVAVVTGAASGIGKEIARKFADEGAKVVIADLNQQGADAAAKELDKSGKRAVGVAMDVTSEPQVEAGMAQAVAAFGRLDILVSNAGIQIVAPLDEFEFAKWKQLLAIHLDGAFLTTRAALRQIYKQGTGGSIIYMGSVHSKEASPLKAPYVTAKHGIWSGVTGIHAVCATVPTVCAFVGAALQRRIGWIGLHKRKDHCSGTHSTMGGRHGHQPLFCSHGESFSGVPSARGQL
jgi:NAD(P)-dependent dehydrogenase (short-subunit alcohol dehydrogenase family)